MSFIHEIQHTENTQKTNWRLKTLQTGVAKHFIVISDPDLLLLSVILFIQF